MNYLSVDVGGSALKYAIMDEGYHILEQGAHPARPESLEQFLATVGEFYVRADWPEGGIAISYCGEVDEARGVALTGGSYPFVAGACLTDELEGRLGCRVSVENDGNCAALAELAAGSLRGCRDAVVIVVGTGLGGGIVIDGRIHHGAHKFAGGLSLLATTLEANLAEAHGYTDAPVVGKLAGAAALAQGYVVAHGEALAEGLPTNGREFFALVDAGDPVAARVLEGYARSLVTIVYNLQQVLDVEAFAVGGGVSAAPTFGAALRGQLDLLYAGSFATRLGLQKPELHVCRFRNEANLIGALAHHLSRVAGTTGLEA